MSESTECPLPVGPVIAICDNGDRLAFPPQTAHVKKWDEDGITRYEVTLQQRPEFGEGVWE